MDPEKAIFSPWGPGFGPQIQFFISRLPELRFRSSKACTTRIWPLWTYFSNFVTCCDNPVPVWHLPWRNMMSWFWTYGAVTAPKSQTLYLDFPRSLIIIPRHAGPKYILCGSINSMSWPLVTIQYRCDTSPDVIWCHDFGPTAPLRRQNL